MAMAAPNGHRAASEVVDLHRQKEAAIMLIVVPGAQTAVEYAATYLVKGPMYNSVFTGAAWIHELLNRHATRFSEALGIAKPVLLQLCCKLQALQASKFEAPQPG